MKIVHQVLSGDLAGGQLIAVRLAEAARAGGHDVALVSPADGPLLARCAASGIPTRIVPLGRSFRIDLAARYARLLRAERADVLHTHSHLAGNVLARLAGALARVPVVAHMHIENVFRAGRLGRSAQVALDNATARLCSRIVAVSEATRSELVRQGYPGSRVEVVRNGVSLDRAQPLRLTDGPVVVHVGRLAPVKGQRELLRAVASLENVHVVLVGRDLEQSGRYLRALEREAQRLEITDRVLFTGQRDDVPALLAGADVVALPSLIEGLPLVVLEAMAQARPVVATAVGGTPELVVHGETGLLVPPRDVPALTSALAELLEDPERARRLGEAGRRRAEREFSEEAMIRRVLEIYEEVVA